jgi:hypothetical protein
MKIIYGIKNTVNVFRKIEDISARKFPAINYSSHVPHTSRTASCKQLSAVTRAIIFRTYSLTSNGRMIENNEVETILQEIIFAYFEVPSA